MPKGKKIDKGELMGRRMRARALLDEGVSQAQVAREVGVSRESVRRWAGMSRLELSKVKAQGRSSRLTAPAREVLRAILLAGPKGSGFQTELWTVPRVRKVVMQRFGLRFSTVHVWRLLGQLNFSSQKAVSQAQGRDEDKIELWKSTDRRRLQKKLSGRAARSSSSTKTD